jgi:hypothetical protein
MWDARYSCRILAKLKFSRKVSKKYSNIKFSENSSGSRVVPFWRIDRQTDMTKPIDAFRKFANAPKNGSFVHLYLPYNSDCFFKH